MSSQPCVYPGLSFSTSPPNRHGLRKRRLPPKFPMRCRPAPGMLSSIMSPPAAGAGYRSSETPDSSRSDWRKGDIAVIPHGDSHVISSAPGMRAEPNLDMHRRPEDSNALPFALRTGGEGASDTHVICGFFSCDARPFNPLLDSLPRFIRLRRDASQASHGLLHQFIRFATAETGNKRAGSQSVLNRLSELMFVEVIRLHMDQLANNSTGWLAGLRDPLVGRALTLLHARPAHAWTLEELAAQAAASRSTLADRFSNLV